MKPIKIALCFLFLIGLLVACKKESVTTNTNNVVTIKYCDTAHCTNAYCDSTTNSCHCYSGYEGQNCTTESRAKYYGTYSSNDVCSPSGNYTYTMSISASSNGISNISIANFGNSGASIIVTADINGLNITIPSQIIHPGGANITVVGSGTLSADNHTLFITYSTSQGSSTFSCTCVATK